MAPPVQPLAYTFGNNYHGVNHGIMSGENTTCLSSIGNSKIVSSMSLYMHGNQLQLRDMGHKIFEKQETTV